MAPLPLIHVRSCRSTCPVPQPYFSLFPTGGALGLTRCSAFLSPQQLLPETSYLTYVPPSHKKYIERLLPHRI